MKKNLFKYSVASFAITLSFVFISCGDDDAIIPIPNEPEKVQIKEAVTGDATNVSYFWATVSGMVNLTEGTKYNDWIEYSDDNNFKNRIRCSVEDAGSSFSVELNNLDMETTYYYRTYVKTDSRNYYGETESFTTKKLELQKNGAVDLGLSVKWAANNIGADKPEECGSYIEWGETSEKETLSYSFCYDEVNNLYSSADLGKEISGTKYDAARVQWGGKWRLPTAFELKELNEECRNIWYIYNGMNGRLFIGRNDNCIFLPAAGEISSNGELMYVGKDGRYQSGTLSEDHDRWFGTMFICKYFVGLGDDGFRLCRYTIRPVSD